MMPKSRKDIIDRTIENLRCVDERVVAPHEVTQLVNSFLMTLLQNWDDLEPTWSNLSQKDIQWPKAACSDPTLQPRDFIGKIRDALAHGCFVFEGHDGGEIERLSLWTCPDRTTVDWDLTITVNDMRQMLKCFASIAARQPLATREAKQKGQPCKP